MVTGTTWKWSPHPWNPWKNGSKGELGMEREPDQKFQRSKEKVVRAWHAQTGWNFYVEERIFGFSLEIAVFGNFGHDQERLPK